MGRALFAAGFRAGDLVHNSFSYHLTPAGSMMESGAHAIGCTVFPAGTGQTELQVQAMAALAPTAYAGTPSFLRLLLEKADETGVALPSLSKAALSGEAVPPSVREWLGTRGIAAYQSYGTADLGLVAYETSARDGLVVDKDTGTERLPLHELARIAYFRPDTLPPGFQAELMATRHYVPRAWPFGFTNGIQASWLEVDIESGFVKLLKHWCVEDCGTVINPQLVDEQVRGGIVQGIGGALFEHCIYDERGQLLNGNMADYLVPMAVEMPDIEVGHVVTPTADSELGAKGAGEAGTAGAPGSVMNAINDALRPLGAAPLTDMPFTPDKILRALGKV